MSSEAFVTLATNDGYALGALVLAQSLRKVGTQRRLVVLTTKTLSNLLRQTLDSQFDEVIVVEELNSNDDEHLRLLSRPELGITFTKINCWLLENYSKCVFLDSDIVVLKNIDDLFQREEFSAAPDAGWPDCFNSGVFVYRPSKETFRKLVQFANQQNASFDGGDQGLLNGFFSNWRTADISRHLPFTYNVTANTFYSYLPAVTQFRNDIRVVHFAGALKPWQLTYNPQNEQLFGNISGQNDIQREFLLSWWRILYEKVWPELSKNNQQQPASDVSDIIELTKNSPLRKSFSLMNFTQIRRLSSPSIIDDLFHEIALKKYLKIQLLPENCQRKKHHSGKTQSGLNIGGTSLFNYQTLTNDQGVQAGSVAHRRAWEAGHVDYHGRDSFNNIQEQLQKNIQHQQQQYHPSQLRQTTPPKSTTDVEQGKEIVGVVEKTTITTTTTTTNE